MIEIKNIHKNYQKIEVLKGIDLKVKETEILSITGASGSGKSTLLHIIGALENPDQGKIIIQGNDIFTLSERDLAIFRNKKIGFVFQFHHLLPEFTAFENVCIPGYIGKNAEVEIQKKAKSLLDFLGLGHRIEHKPSEMSGGEQQRVAIARALINEPSVILADEPSGNLDDEATDEIHKLFFQLRDEFGQTFVIVTHDNRLAEMSDRKVVLKEGKILI
jgi:lipoprotein-releasing system ATP-binding protein